MKKASSPKAEYRLRDYVKVTKGFFEGFTGLLVNIDYEGGSFQIQLDDETLKDSEDAYFVYADEIELLERNVEIGCEEEDEE